MMVGYGVLGRGVDKGKKIVYTFVKVTWLPKQVIYVL
jgi:hypothetical protein